MDGLLRFQNGSRVLCSLYIALYTVHPKLTENMKDTRDRL